MNCVLLNIIVEFVCMADKFLREKVIAGIILSRPNEDFWSPFLVGNDYYPKIIFKSDGMRISVKSKFDNVLGESFQNTNLTNNDFVVESPVNGWGVSFENLRVKIGNKKTILNFKVVNPETINLTLSDNFYRLADMVSMRERLTAAEESKIQYLKKSWEY
jgi:hypothetical protein